MQAKHAFTEREKEEIVACTSSLTLPRAAHGPSSLCGKLLSCFLRNHTLILKEFSGQATWLSREGRWPNKPNDLSLIPRAQDEKRNLVPESCHPTAACAVP